MPIAADITLIGVGLTLVAAGLAEVTRYTII